MNATRICSIDGCERHARSRGMCGACYSRAWRAGKIQPQLPLVERHSLSSIDVETRTAICSVCGPTRIRVRTGNRGSECWTVRKRHIKRSKGKYKSRKKKDGSWLKSKYGITRDQYLEMVADQGGLCAICGTEYHPLMVDHCHVTGVVRGLLCRRCNIALGWMEDKVDRLRAAADYLEAVESA